ncbi:MAG: complex I NDUFA9 subunit family protein [Hyphomicrobiales bacterium]|nr:complex I NDUFA9 subunit family protein [Hyphomicrobiales bacterium]
MPTMKDRRIVTVFGASGFVGRHLVRRLAADGAIVRAAVRDTEAALFLKPMGDLGQIVPVAADVTNRATVDAAVAGADAVVNLVGILAEWGKRTFQAFHAEGAANVAAAARDAGIGALVHMSALGADADSQSDYARTKAEGEAAVRAAFPAAVIVRPSVIFGPEDGFFNLFAGLTRWSPVLPVFGCPVIPAVKVGGRFGLDVDFYGDGGTKFQPVYVGDVAEAIFRALGRPDCAGKTYELGGPRVYGFKDVMDLILRIIDRRRILAPVPFAVGSIMGFFLEWWPKPLLTRDQATLLRRDNVVADGALGLADLDIVATPAEAVLPGYLARFRPAKRQTTRTA